MAVIVSTIFNVAYYTFTDGDWMMRRTRRFDGPLNIYELHLGSWKKNGGENGMTVNFLKIMNMGLRRLHPTAMLIAEDSSVYPGVTREPDWELLKLPAHGASSAH